MTIPRVAPNGFTNLTTAQAAQFDANLQRALSKQTGGTISAPITVSGTAAAITATAANVAITCSGAGSLMSTASGARFQCGDNDYPLYSAPRTRTVIVPCLEYAPSNVTFTYGGTRLKVNSTWGGLQSTGGIYTSGAVPLTRVHDGANLTQVSLYFLVDAGRTALPSWMPTLNMTRVDVRTGLSVQMMTAGIGYAQFARPASVAAYQNSGAPNVLTYAVDASMQTIDVSRYAYIATFGDDSGEGVVSGGYNIYLAFALTFANIIDERFP